MGELFITDSWKQNMSKQKLCPGHAFLDQSLYDNLAEKG